MQDHQVARKITKLYKEGNHDRKLLCPICLSEDKDATLYPLDDIPDFNQQWQMRECSECGSVFELLFKFDSIHDIKLGDNVNLVQVAAKYGESSLEPQRSP